MNQDQIQQLIDRSVEEKLRSFSNLAVPVHRHNHVDSPGVVMGDLLLDNRGLVFPSFKGNYVMNVNNGPGGQSIFYVSPPMDGSGNPLGDFALNGPDGEVYKVITLSSLTDTNISVGSMANNTNWLFGSSSTAVISSGFPWRLTLPVNLTLPASPGLGQICFYSSDGGLTGNLMVCEATGTWTPL